MVAIKTTTVAYLGPEYSFSHDLVRTSFPNATHVKRDKLLDVVAAVAKGECSKGVVPFFNTYQQSVKETQVSVIAHHGRVFVADILALKVKHYLAGHGTVSDVKRVRSKSVVFAQASDWLAGKLPSVQHDHYESTSAAVKSLSVDQDITLAAIGTKSACINYKVPVIVPNIQNKPNVTAFFSIQREKPNPQDCDRVLLCTRNATEDDANRIEAIVKASGCIITSAWKLREKEKSPRFSYFCELDGQHAILDLNASVSKITTEVKGTVMMGGYRNRCITRLIFGT